MLITLYQRTYPVKDAPVAISLVPHNSHQRHTLTVGDTVYEAQCKELRVIAPDEAKIDMFDHLVKWQGDKGLVRSTAREVFALAHAAVSGFRMAN